MASPIESPTWEREVLCGCKGCAVARKPLQDAIQRIRDLHYEDTTGNCATCCTAGERYGDGYFQVSFPCDTYLLCVKALDGEQ